jgi:molybdopterin molybdotransferase
MRPLEDGRVRGRSDDPARALVALSDARRRIAALSLRPPRVERVPVAAAIGRWPVRAVRCPIDLPPGPTAAMDGYAVAWRPSEPRTEYALVSAPRRVPLRPGEACPIGTGARLPRGARAVARVESTRADGRILHLHAPPADGQDVRAAGESVQRGAVLARPGRPIDAYAGAALIAVGVRTVAVRRVRVAVIATGTELLARRPGPSAARDAIGPWVAATAGPWAEVEHRGIVGDDLGAIRSAITRASRSADLVVTIGGSSIGPRDFTKRAVAEAGRLVFSGTRINVLKRAGVGVVRGTPVLILPGQVESAIVAFHEHGLALLGRLLGADLAERIVRPLARGLRVARRMDSTVLVEERGGSVTPLGWGVARYSALVRAHAFGYFRRGRPYRAGERVRLQRLIRAYPAPRPTLDAPRRTPGRAARRPRRR